MKKFFALFTVIMLLMTLAIPASAADEGTITINNITGDATYEIYKLLDLESYNPSTGAYSYKVNSNWSGFFATAEALQYISIDASGYVTWVNGDDADSVANFAKLALAYAKDNGIAPVQSSKNDGEFFTATNDETGVTSGKFSDLELGYYLVDSTMGALCGLTTTNPDAFINAKNGIPTIDNQVQGDRIEIWDEQKNAVIGQSINFRTTINVHSSAENYVLNGITSAGLNFIEVVGIEHIIPGLGVGEILSEGNEYEVVLDQAGHTFRVKFSEAFCETLEINDKIIVYYEAVLNENAKNVNQTEIWLEYGNLLATTHDVAEVFVTSENVRDESEEDEISGSSQDDDLESSYDGEENLSSENDDNAISDTENGDDTNKNDKNDDRTDKQVESNKKADTNDKNKTKNIIIIVCVIIIVVLIAVLAVLLIKGKSNKTDKTDETGKTAF